MLSYLNIETSQVNVKLSGLIGFAKKITQAVKSPFPRGTAISNPLLYHRQTGLLDAAGADPSDLLGLHEAALLQHL
jgi:hypothetical protein